MNDIWMIILGMAIVTYIPRVLPFFILEGKVLPSGLKKFLDYVPYTALGALIIPGAVTALPEKPLASLVGLGFAVIYSWLRGSIIVAVMGSIGVVYLILLIGA